MIAPLTGDEKIPAPPPKEAKDMAPPDYSSVFATSHPRRSASSTHASPSAFDAAMLTPDVVRRASGSSSTAQTMPASASTSALSPSSSRTSSSSSRTPYSSSASSSHPRSKSQPHLPSPAREHRKERGSGAKFVRALSTGLLAIVVPPIAVGGVAIAATGAVLYGSGKLVEGIGRGISVGPEMAWKAYKSERGRRARRMFSGGNKEERAASVPPRRSREKAEAEVGAT